MNTINYQQIFEDETSTTLHDQLGLKSRFFELSNTQRMMVEELIEAGYRRAVEDALDPNVLEETADLTVEMAAQLSGFADLLRSYLHSSTVDDS